MNCFVDTSGLLAVLDADDEHHPSAKDVWIRFISSGTHLTCTNYVLVETFALVQRRLGLEAVRVLQEDVIPVMHIEWVDDTTHHRGISALLAASRRKLSLVDCVSFECMRRLGIRNVLACDQHFNEQGFTCHPSG